MAEENNVIDRDYVDNFSIKELATEHIMPTYFPDEETSNLTTGTIGMLTEYISTITEDSFNTGSSLVTEAFPTRARMESSIYANAAIFQLTNAFSDASTCDFLVIIPEEDIQNNFVSKEGSSYRYFYIGKGTCFYITGIPFTLDYDIEIRAMYRETEHGWIYSAKYMMNDYVNSVSDKKDPYIKLRKTKTGLVVLQLTLKQYARTVVYDSIVENATLNYPTINIPISGKLLGFDVLYKAPGASGYNTQLETKVMYSLPSKSPFCYYKMIDSKTLELSFTTKDAYFQPKFNSDLMIVIYTTEGEDGNFPAYDGKEIAITKGEEYEYQNSWLISGKPISGATGGKEKLSTEGLQQLTVEGFSTANALTTEHDIQLYFNNYKNRYNNEILAIKKRNDAVELLFTTFMYLRNKDYIYPTNTLNMDTNVLEFDIKDGGFYNLDPGFLFGYNEKEVFFEPLFYLVVDGSGEKYNKQGHFYNAEGRRDKTMDISENALKRKIREGSLKEAPRTYWSLENGTSQYHLYCVDGTVMEKDPLSQEKMYEYFKEGYVEYGTLESSNKSFDFIVDFEKEIEAKKAYVDYFEKYKELKEKPDLTFEEYLFDYTFKDYKNEKGIDNRRTVFNTDVEEFAKTRKFMFTNPFVLTITKDSGLISYYQSFISQDCSLDFVNENDDDAFVQFISYTLHVERDVSEDKKYRIKMVILPSVTAEEGYNYCNVLYDENDESLFQLYEGAKPSLTNFDKDYLRNNRLRVVMSFKNREDTVIGYMELIPTAVDDENEQITFEAEIHTDDYITTSNNIRMIHICPHCGNHILNSANANIDNKDYYCDHCHKTFKEGIINIMQDDNIMIPITGLNVEITTLYMDPANDGMEITNNDFSEYDEENFSGYIWTNTYSTYSDSVTLIKPLDMIRSSITYKDYYVPENDAMDCIIRSVPLLKYSVLAYKDEGMKITDPLICDDIGKFQYFMDSFLNSYEILREAKTKLGGMNIDMKFYNTYGKSTNFTIGDNGELIDTNNIAIYFDIWVNSGVDIFECEKELKVYIKNYIETINEKGTNNLYVSNLIRKIENEFAYVNHLIFKGINGYDTTYQTIVNKAIDMDDLTKEEKRDFVPDILVINPNNVHLSFYQQGK